MTDDATTLASKTKQEPSVLSTEGQEIKRLNDRMKEVRKKENMSERERERERAEQN